MAPPELDIDHVAKLANLPLDDGEREALLAACGHVLEAFGLEDVEADLTEDEPVSTFPDHAEPWPDEGVQALLEQVPERDGRRIQT